MYPGSYAEIFSSPLSSIPSPLSPPHYHQNSREGPVPSAQVPQVDRFPFALSNGCGAQSGKRALVLLLDRDALAMAGKHLS